MTDPRQAEREQQARELWNLLEGAGPYFGPTKDLPVKAIVEAFKATEAAALEEVATEMERHPYWSKEAKVWIEHLRQLAQERRA